MKKVLVLCLTCLLFLCGCLKRDTMEDIICAVMGMFTYLGVFTLSRSTSSFHKFIEKISVN